MIKTSLLYKTLVVGILVLFIGVGIQPAIADNVDKVDNKLKDSTEEIGTYDDYQEIITFVSGTPNGEWMERIGTFRGSIVYKCYPEPASLNLVGLRISNGKIKLYREIDINYVYIPHYIGIYRINGFIVPYGIAIGNIDWW